MSPRNALLASLPLESWAALRSKLSPVELPAAQRLYRADASIDAVYFVQAGMISLFTTLEDGSRAEIGIVGREGMLGISLLAAADTSFFDAMVQIPGNALQMSVPDFRHALGTDAPFRSLLLRYGEALHAQITQTAVCNGHHGLERRLARWLLMALDRIDGDEVPLTQEFLAMMLGVPRPGITVTAGILEAAGLIRYAPDRVTVLDRANLEAAACECYRAVHRRHASLLQAAAA